MSAEGKNPSKMEEEGEDDGIPEVAGFDREDKPGSPAVLTGIVDLRNNLLIERQDLAVLLGGAAVFGLYLGSQGYFKYLNPCWYAEKVTEFLNYEPSAGIELPTIPPESFPSAQ